MSLFCLLAGGVAARAADAPREGWAWPVPPPATVVSPYEQPAHRYAPGHRGIDLAADGDVLAPADGVVAFVGQVAGRQVVTISHPGELVTTLEPVTATISTGDTVRAGDVVGRVSVGGHAAPGTVHFGVRLRGEYINPLSVLGDVPAAILLPCCS